MCGEFLHTLMDAHCSKGLNEGPYRDGSISVSQFMGISNLVLIFVRGRNGAVWLCAHHFQISKGLCIMQLLQQNYT